MGGILGKKEQFYVKQVSATEKEVVLTGKYTINSEHPLFEAIEFIVPMIEEKNEREKNKYHDVFEISYFHTLEFTLGKCKMED